MQKLIPGFHGGISQQVQELRLPTQLQDALNVIGDPVNGVRRRPPISLHPSLNRWYPGQNPQLITGDDGYPVIPFETDGYRGFFVVTGQTVIVKGTDNKYYVCKVAHTASDDNKPITGANWQAYWQLYGQYGSPVVPTSTWTLGAKYGPPLYAMCGSAPIGSVDFLHPWVFNYLYGANVSLHYSQILDSTIITNRRVTVANDTAIYVQDGRAFIWVARGAANTLYSVDICIATMDPYTYAETTMNIQASYTSGSTIDTSVIANGLADAIVAALSAAGVSNIAVYTQGSQIAVVPVGTPFGRRVGIIPKDGLGGSALRGISSETLDPQAVHTNIFNIYQNVVQSTTDLPPQLLHGVSQLRTGGGGYTPVYVDSSDRVVHVRGSSGAGYYTTYDVTTGAWVETRGRGVYDKIFEGTLPIKVMFKGIVGGQAQFAVGLLSMDETGKSSLVSRKVGDLLTAPDPSFVGRTIDGTFFSNNRLGFFYGDSVFLSAIGDYYNFYPKTAQEVLDDDPIDLVVDSGNNRNVNFLYTKGFNGRLLLFSSSGEQFELTSGQQAMTPFTAQLVQVSSFKIDPRVQAEVIGNRLYFIEPNDNGGYSLKLIQDTADGVSVSDLSTAVPRLLQSADLNGLRICGFPGSSAVLLASPKVLLEYRMMYNDNGERISSSWWRHALPQNRNVNYWAAFSDEIVALATNGPQWDVLRYDPDSQQRVFLDYMFRLSDAYSVSFDGLNTVFDLEAVGKYKVVDDLTRLVIVDQRTLKEVEYTLDGFQVKIQGNVMADSVYYLCGLRTDWYFQLSDIYDRTPDGSIVPTDLYVKYIQLEYVNTGEFKTFAQGKPNQRPWIKQFWSQRLNTSNTGEMLLESSRTSPYPFKMPVFTRAKGATLIVSGSSYLPAQFILGIAECE